MSPRLMYLLKRFNHRLGWELSQQDFQDAHDADRRMFRGSCKVISEW